ncbi:hypothetical protein ASE59_14235 [Sphingomonas sp. Leaf10]|nr:hypothetical protein ASE59_14235 [Sphingomonas sp. Leaf10]
MIAYCRFRIDIVLFLFQFYRAVSGQKGKAMFVVSWYRARCFDRPVGPWRERFNEACLDLEAADLASRDERGQLFITVPGDVQVLRDYDAMASATCARRAR